MKHRVCFERRSSGGTVDFSGRGCLVLFFLGLSKKRSGGCGRVDQNYQHTPWARMCTLRLHIVLLSLSWSCLSLRHCCSPTGTAIQRGEETRKRGLRTATTTHSRPLLPHHRTAGSSMLGTMGQQEQTRSTSRGTRGEIRPHCPSLETRAMDGVAESSTRMSTETFNGHDATHKIHRYSYIVPLPVAGGNLDSPTQLEELTPAHHHETKAKGERVQRTIIPRSTNASTPLRFPRPPPPASPPWESC